MVSGQRTRSLGGKGLCGVLLGFHEAGAQRIGAERQFQARNKIANLFMRSANRETIRIWEPQGIVAVQKCSGDAQGHLITLFYFVLLMIILKHKRAVW